MLIGIALLVLLALAGMAAAAVWVARLLRTELGGLKVDSGSQLAERNAELDRRMQSMVETMDRRLEALDTKVDRRLESAGETTKKIHERLGEVGKRDQADAGQREGPLAARAGAAAAQGARRLRRAAAGEPPARPAPQSAYTMQYGFDGGVRVDAVVRVGQLIPVDSKFPLDNYQRIVEAENDDEKVLHEKAFARDVKLTSTRSRRSTSDPRKARTTFAFMYIPVESVYYELACGKTGALLQYAHGKRIFPVSPDDVHRVPPGDRARDARHADRAARARGDGLRRRPPAGFREFTEDFDLIGTHLGRAQSKFTEPTSGSTSSR